MTESYDPQPEPTSIDDALEEDRVVPEPAEPRGADGHGVDADTDRGGDDSAAAEQGNRDEDEMEAEEEDPRIEEILRFGSEDGESGPPLG